MKISPRHKETGHTTHKTPIASAPTVRHHADRQAMECGRHDTREKAKRDLKLTVEIL